MKKFLCYDTNDAASGKINVDNRGILKPNSTVPSGSTPYQQLVTDGDGNTRWDDRLAYEYTEWKDFTLSLDSTAEITGFSMPPVGDTVTVKVNGVESVETVKSGEFSGLSYSYIGSVNFEEFNSGTEGWLVADVDSVGVIGKANPETTVSLPITEQHKIDEKYIQQDKNFVRPLSYYIGNSVSTKTYYNESGDSIITYKRDKIIMPKLGTAVIYDLAEIGIGSIWIKGMSSFTVGVYKFTNGVMQDSDEIYGIDETDIADLAARMGYTLTTKPTT